MKKILLSFKPFWYEKIKNGEKIFEYRKRFCDEPVMAYMYVSRPVMAISGIIMLDKRISLDAWKNQYKDDKEIYDRINDFAKRNNYAMPILEYVPTTSISLREIQNVIPGFMAPQMYYNLDKNCNLLKLLEEKIQIMDGRIENSFNKDIKSKICEKLLE